MKRKTRRLIEELDAVAVQKDKIHVIESRGNHVIQSAINLINMIREQYDGETALDLERRLINSIRGQDERKFTRAIRKIDESKDQ